ncbi:hypothetical protein chiPu_0010387 [Chiloscyllium punctatum]|uniref:Uncharacterized protein n=1 Tax=Chiloscyllium punctatum TaxID=137246 RepID=A0A401SNG6_CHIPU|nr:hypothetical protein [Chiloscyllium punctatum]
MGGRRRRDASDCPATAAVIGGCSDRGARMGEGGRMRQRECASAVGSELEGALWGWQDGRELASLTVASVPLGGGEAESISQTPPSLGE